MRILLTILFLIYLPDLWGKDPGFTIEQGRSLFAIAFSADEKAMDPFDKINTINALISHFSVIQQDIYQRERFYIKSRFSGRTAAILKATDIKLSYKYVVVPVPFKQLMRDSHSVLLNSSPFVSVLLNRKSIYSEAYAFHGYPVSNKTNSLHDLGVSIGAGLRVPISSRLLLDVGVRDELGLLNLDGFILGKNSFSENNSLGVILGLKYKI